jgi:hypothetical protein
MKEFRIFGMLLLFALCSLNGAGASPVTVRVDAGSPKWTVSKYLTGSHFVYAYEPDSLYKDERIADWMRRSKVGVIRWPGGTAVQQYHWDQLNGIAFKVDSWNPAYNAKPKAPTDYMDLDEFVAFCRRVGAEPMVGINILSGKKYNRDAAAKEEAHRLITYCRDKKYKVKFWYIGNECYKGFGEKSYARYIDEYADVLKAVDSNIVIIADWKFGPESKERFAQALEIAKTARQLDVLEIHEKWGNEWGLASGRSVADWRNEYPIYNGRLGEYIRMFSDEMQKAGRPDVRLAFNEWGLGYVQGGDEFDHALVAADFMIELFRNPVYQACYWNLNMGNKTTRVLNTRKARHDLIELNPVAYIFEMYAHALGQPLLALTSSSKSVYGFAVGSNQASIQVFLLNKNETTKRVKIEVADRLFDAGDIQLESFQTPGKIKHEPVAHFGSAKELTLELQPFTFNRIVIRPEKH